MASRWLFFKERGINAGGSSHRTPHSSHRLAGWGVLRLDSGA